MKWRGEEYIRGVAGGGGGLVIISMLKDINNKIETI